MTRQGNAPRAREANRLRAYGISAVAGGAAVGILVLGHHHFPLGEWLVWRYAAYWACTIVMLSASLAAGARAVRLVLPRLPLLERWAVGLPLGVFLFELVIFFAGVLQLYAWPLFFVAPLLLLAFGLGTLRADLRTLRRHRALRRLPTLPGRAWLIILVGLVALLMVYLACTIPWNVMFDARWKHLGLAEEWVARGGVQRFAEGRTFAARPHFTSYLYTWAFLYPSQQLFDSMVLSQHLEFGVFAFTNLFGLPLLVRRIAPGIDPRLAWAFRFFYPGVLLADSSLAAGADHIGAAFAIPIALLTLRATRTFDRRQLLLLGVFFGVCMTVKYTLIAMLLPGCALWVTGCGVRRLWRSEDRAATLRWLLSGAGLVAAAALVTASPHFVKNLVWYQNPVYPLMSDVFPSTPWGFDAGYLFRFAYQEYQFWRPERSLQGLLETLGAMVSFGFVPHDYKKFHGVVPVFGFLFGISVLLLAFVRQRGRVLPIVAWTYSGIFVWYSLHHQDRYLQTLMPLIAACTAVVFLRCMAEHGRTTRLLLGTLLGVQVVFGADVWFYPTNHRIGSAPMTRLSEFIGQGYEKEYKERFEVSQRWESIGESLPEDAVVLVHENHDTLGLRRARVGDFVTWQFLLNYGYMESPRQLHDAFADLGVTHFLTRRARSRGFESLAGDIIFHDYFRHRTADFQRHGRWGVATRSDELIGDNRPYAERSVMVLGCKNKRGRGYRSGIYSLSELREPTIGPRGKTKALPRPSVRIEKSKPRESLAGVDYVAIDRRCKQHKDRKWLKKEFSRLVKIKSPWRVGNPKYVVYERKKRDRGGR